MIYLYLFGTCFHFIYVFMIIGTILYYRGNSQTKKMGSSLVFALFYNGWQGCPSFSIQF